MNPDETIDVDSDLPILDEALVERMGADDF
jgi:hypothetical protein